ncbi:LppU/SCO3897 family protein [Micromonospora sp. CA-244673]|uniref:LppU/SCO3897 family protein n=1 Tax=Micromonospora sp. CA-244673 TaxID=3239958 RepID=UPI003D8C8F7B
MTSEAPHRPGQEPGEVSPGAGGPVPYGDRPAQQDNGYGAPDLGWAPPPPAGRPAQPAPAWAAADDQPPAWTPPGNQPAAGRATAQVPPPAEPGGWSPASQPAWAAPEQSAPAWGAPDQGAPAWGAPEQADPHRGAEPGQPAWAAAPPDNATESAPPAWANEQSGPTWGAAPAPSGEQPAWAQAGEPGARGAASVPAPATVPNESWATPAGQDDANRPGGWTPATGQQDDDPGRSGGWRAAQEDNSGGWAVGAAAQQQDAQPAWGQQGEQGWSPAEPPARAAAKVSVPGAARPESAWPAQDDQGHAGAWQSAPAPSQGEDQGHPDRWQQGQADEQGDSGRWQNGRAAQDDDPDRSGGWAAGRSAGAAEAPQPAAWGASDEQRPGAAWNGAASVPHQREPERPADEPGQPGWGSAAVPAAAESPARASASVPSPDSPPAWGGNQDNQGQWARERPAIPEAEPWAPGEAWGRAAEAQPEQSAAPGWEPARADDGPIYQPAPGPGISPANAVPLPPQEQRVPGAALAAAPPADYAPFNPGGEPGDRNPQAYEPAADAGRAHEEPQSPAGPMVPGPRTSPEGGAVSASASVPMTSRVTPPADQPLPTSGAPGPQPRVYGRPARPEPEEAPGQDGPNGFAEPGPHPRTDESDRQHGYADAPPVHSAPPSSPAAPPPFPPGVPSFVDPPGNNRPVNGVHPHNGERPGGPHDPFGGPAGPHEPFGAPGGHQDPFGGPPGHRDQFGGPGGPGEPFGGPAGGRASVGVPGQGPMGEPGGFPPAFPPPPQQGPPAWPQAAPGGDPDQGRFEAFKPDAEPKTEAPTPKVRNGRVLAAVLIAAVLILAVPLGLLTLLGKIGGDDKPAAFDPAVGSCVKQSGTTAVAADCGEQGAFTVVSKVDSKDKCADPAQPQVVLPGDGTNRVLCLKPAGQ